MSIRDDRINDADRPLTGCVTLAGIAAFVVISAHIIIAGGAGLVVCYGMCQVMRIEEMQLLHRLGNRFFGRFLNRR